MSVIVINKDGSLVAIYDETVVPALANSSMRIQRASHVEPIFGGEWGANLSPVGGPLLGPFKRRSEALAAEVAWLEEKLPSLNFPAAAP